jgi:PAS domain S-box-containing protein
MMHQNDLSEGAGNLRVIQGQSRALELAIKGAPIGEILDVLVHTIEDQSSNDVLGSVLLTDEDGKHLLHGAAPSLPQAYCDAIHGIEIGPKVGSCGTAAHSGKTVIVKDIQTDPLWANFKTLATEHGLRACWSTPILSSSGKVLGTFALYHKVPMEPSERDKEIVSLLANTAALVIERDREAKMRVAIEDQLRAERDQQIQQLQRMFEHAPAGIASLAGPEHVFTVANPRYLEMVANRPMLGKTVREALPELEGQGIYELLDTVLRTGEPYIGRALPVQVMRGEGKLEQAYFDFVYQPVPDRDGKVESILAVVFEVTDLVKAKLDAEAARVRAERSEQMLLTFVDNLPELAWTAQPDGSIDFYNKRWYEYTGTTFEEMQGWGWEKVHDPELLPLVVDRWKHSLETGEPFEMEFTLKGADGIRRWFLTRVAPVRDEQGRIVRWFGTNTNIDEIKSAMALTEEVARQSLEYQEALNEMRLQIEATERKIHELVSR